MIPRRPEDINRFWSDALQAGDVDRMLNLYEPNAILIAEPDGDSLIGHDAIKEALHGLLATGLRAQFKQRYCLVSGNIALIRADFVLSGGDGDNAMEIKGSTSEVLRLQDDGTWRYVVDHAFGAIPNNS